MRTDETLREVVIAKAKAALGEPEVAAVECGFIYRWRLERGPTDFSVFVTIDSPEHPDIAHVMVSDSPRYQQDLIVSTIVQTPEQADILFSQILDQWHRPQPL